MFNDFPWFPIEDWLHSFAIFGIMLMFWGFAGNRIKTAIRRHTEIAESLETIQEKL